MKSLGIVRKADKLGRIVIPIETRRSLGIDVEDALEIFVDGKKIILQKYQPDMEKQDVIQALEEVALNAGPEAADVISRAINLIK